MSAAYPDIAYKQLTNKEEVNESIFISERICLAIYPHVQAKSFNNIEKKKKKLYSAIYGIIFHGVHYFPLIASLTSL